MGLKDPLELHFWYCLWKLGGKMEERWRNIKQVGNGIVVFMKDSLMGIKGTAGAK